MRETSEALYENEICQQLVLKTLPIFQGQLQTVTQDKDSQVLIYS